MSRIFAPLMGAAWTYASLSRKRASAPGQLTVRELKEIWEKAEMIDAQTQLYGSLRKPGAAQPEPDHP